MASKSSKSKTSVNEKTDYHARQVRRTRIIFGVVAIILVLSMTLSMLQF